MTETPKKLSLPTPVNREVIKMDETLWVLEQLERWAAYREQCRAEIREANWQMALLRDEVDQRTSPPKKETT